MDVKTAKQQITDHIDKLRATWPIPALEVWVVYDKPYACCYGRSKWKFNTFFAATKRVIIIGAGLIELYEDKVLYAFINHEVWHSMQTDTRGYSQMTKEECHKREYEADKGAVLLGSNPDDLIQGLLSNFEAYQFQLLEGRTHPSVLDRAKFVQAHPELVEKAECLMAIESIEKEIFK